MKTTHAWLKMLEKLEANETIRRQCFNEHYELWPGDHHETLAVPPTRRSVWPLVALLGGAVMVLAQCGCVCGQ